MNGMMMQQPQTTQLLLHGVIEARILEADLSVTTDGQLQPSKKVRIVYALLSCTCTCCFLTLEREQSLTNPSTLVVTGTPYLD